jgi:protein SCO1
MIRPSKLALCGIFVGALALGASVAQAQMKVNPELAKKGEKVFQKKGCQACHAFGRRLSGPDLKGVTTTRSEDWLRRWLKDPTAMYNDSTAQELIKESKGIKMPNLHLSDDDITALLNYIAQESEK